MTRTRKQTLAGLVVVALAAATVYGQTIDGFKMPPDTSKVQADGTGRTYGIFIGISNYGGRLSGLPYTAADAVHVREALMRGAGLLAKDAVTLVDSDATVGTLLEALDRFSSQAGPADTVVLFFSGHGSRMERTGGFDPADPDGVDETIELYDAGMRDDELREALDGLSSRVLLVFDSCFSGGFAKDVIVAPGRMGLFSSEEDVVSAVAEEFNAGGYLARFFEQAIGEQAADANQDGLLTAFELSQYLRDRYRNDVVVKGARDYVSMERTDYQHLIVDRGSIAPDETIFHLIGKPDMDRSAPSVVAPCCAAWPSLSVDWSSLSDDEWPALANWPRIAQHAIDFGDDTSKWAHDGECDDPRFEGDGMATTLVDGDRGRDATDCRALFEEGRIRSISR